MLNGAKDLGVKKTKQETLKVTIFKEIIQELLLTLEWGRPFKT